MRLSGHDWSFILESLQYTKQRFDNYKYPTYELRRERLDEVQGVIERIRAALDQDKSKGEGNA